MLNRNIACHVFRCGMPCTAPQDFARQLWQVHRHFYDRLGFCESWDGRTRAFWSACFGCYGLQRLASEPLLKTYVFDSFADGQDSFLT